MSEVTADGRPVDLHAVLPHSGEPTFVHANIPPAAAILDLSNSGGRFANPLAELGHPVTVVDASAAMLSQAHGARTVQADPTTLDLGEQFPVVLMAAVRLNTADELLRTALLATCRRHVTPSGQVIMNWLPPSWFSTVTSSTGRLWPVEVSFSVESFDGTVLHAHSTYRLDATTWEQRTAVRRLSRADLHTALANADLRLAHHLHGGRQFFSAVPTADTPQGA
jgi:hypothetical protein